MLLKAAGQTLQDECKKKSLIQRGDVAVTSGGNLKCKYVFHVVGENFDGRGGKGEKVMYDVIRYVHYTCSSYFVRSCVIQGLGT